MSSRIVSTLTALVVLGLATGAFAQSTLEVSQPVQVTTNAYYERGQAITYDGSNYWLFYGRSATVTVPYSTGNPDVNDYELYYKKAGTVAGLASATATQVLVSALPVDDCYLGETGAAYLGGSVWAFVTIHDGVSNTDLYGYYTSDNGVTWTEVGPYVAGMSGGQGHHDEVVFGGELWILEGSGNFNTMHSATPTNTASFSPPLAVGSLTGGLGHFFVDGSDLYLALGSGGTYYIYKYNSGTVAWDLVDSKVISGYYDPTLYKVGTDYVFHCAPYSGGRQWIVGWTGTTLDGTFFDGTELAVVDGRYGSNVWVDMWPIGYTAGPDSYLFFTSERSPGDPSTEIDGNIWYLEVDWDVTRDHYTYIQEAVDAASSGDDIQVAGGTYTGNIVINTTLTLNGAQAGVDARGRVASESELTVATGHLITIEADDVVLDGLKLTGGGGAQLLRAEDNGSGLVVKNTIAGGSGECILLCNVTSPNILIEQNEWDAASMTDPYALAHFDGSDVFDNLIIRDNNLSNGGIFAGNKTYNSTGLIISGNLFDAASMNLSSQFQDALLDGNTFQNNGYTHGQVGFLNSTISGNTFHVAGPSPYATYPSYGLMLWGDQYGLTPSQNVTLTGNTFNFNGIAAPDELAHGLRILSGIDATTIHIHQNDFIDLGSQAGTYGLLVQGSGSADASCNWWGDAGGPDAPPGNPNPSGAGIDGSAVYWPWLSTQGGACDAYGLNNVAAEPVGDCLSIINTCETVEVNFNRLDTTPARGISVVIELSPELELCVDATTSINQGTWLTGTTTFQVIDNGGGIYTVDQATLGIPCGVTTGGQLFTVDVKAAGPGDAVGTITVNSIIVRDCANAPLAGIPGAPGTLTIDQTAPTAIATLGAVQVKSGNDGDGTTKVTLTWPTVEAGASVEVFRKGFGDYPEYDDLTGAVPTPLSAPGNAGAEGWTSTGVTTSGTDDETTARDFWYFVGFVTDACGNVSTVSNMTGGTLNYHLGDVAPVGNPGNNSVGTLDISDLGDAYGESHGGGFYNAHVDVGPTTDFTVDALPTTDSYIGFEDLMMFAINFMQVGATAPPAGVADVPGGRARLELVTEVVDANHFRARLMLSGNSGDVKGIHAVVAVRGAELLSVERGDLLDLYGEQIFFTDLDEGGAGIHAAILGDDVTIHGQGEVASLLFRGRGAANVQLVVSDLRDAANRFLGDPPQGTMALVDDEAFSSPLPTRYELLGATPNPFNPQTTIRFRLPAETQVSLRIYDVVGRLVRSLVHGALPAGEHGIVWNGRDSHGQLVGSGVYLYAIEAGELNTVEKLVLLK